MTVGRRRMGKTGRGSSGARAGRPRSPARDSYTATYTGSGSGTTRSCSFTSPFTSARLIFPRRRGQVDYAASAAVWDLNSNSMGLT